MSHTCMMCKKRGKDWNGADPCCAFSGEFSDNWNCATLNALREICYEGQNPMPSGVDYQYCDDQKYATVRTDHVTLPNGNRVGLALWVSWYKNRGATDSVWLLTESDPPRHPTEAELLAIIWAYRRISP